MKQQIAEFLGELAEELGWEPGPDEPRIRAEHVAVPATPTPAPTTEPSMTSQGHRDAPSGALNDELKNLRSSLNHLNSEVTQLRAEMARLKNMPLPPDARRRTAGDVPQDSAAPAARPEISVLPVAAGKRGDPGLELFEAEPDRKSPAS